MIAFIKTSHILFSPLFLQSILILTYKFVYNRQRLFEYMANMIDYLPEAGEFTKESIMDAVQTEEDYEDV